MKIFLSYRRADSQTTAGRMAQFLDAVSVVDKVFLDVDGIEVGENFERKIETSLAQSTHVFILIGGQWTGPSNGTATARIFADDDVVRRETRLALASGRKVVPILLDGTRMPTRNELPSDLAELPKINGFALRSAQFDEDMDDLLDDLVTGKRGRGSRWRQAPLTAAGVLLRAIGGAVCGLLLLLLVALLNRVFNDACPALDCALGTMLGSTDGADALGLLWTIAILMAAIGAIAPFIPRLLRQSR
ncbi:MAG: toll/interleukin-1 receptor domain-containing protein [Ideonella sp.]